MVNIKTVFEEDLDRKEDLDICEKNKKFEVLNIINTCAYPDCSKLAFRYRISMTEQEMAIQLLWTFLRGEKQGDKFIPYLLPGCAKSLEDISEASTKLAEIQKDYEAFKEIVGESRSVRNIAEELRRAKLKISNAEHDSLVIWKHALMENVGMSPIEAEKLEVVQTSFRKRDKIKAEYEPLVAELQDKLTKANAVLGKYK